MAGHLPLEEIIGVRIPAPQHFGKLSALALEIDEDLTRMRSKTRVNERQS